MKTKILQYSEVDSEEWDDFVYKNKGGYAYHLYDVIALDRWENDKNKSFAIFDEDRKEIVMIMQLHLEYKKITDNGNSELRARLHSRWGFVYKDGLHRKEFNKLVKGFKEYIDELYKKYNVYNAMEIAIPPLCELMQPQKGNLINQTMFFGYRPSVRYTAVVDLKKNIETMLADCEQTTRQAIRKISNEKRYIVRMADSTREDFDIYVKLHKMTYTRTNCEHAIIRDEYNENIFFNLMPKDLCKVYFLVDEHENKVVAATVILLFKNTAYYWWG